MTPITKDEQFAKNVDDIRNMISLRVLDDSSYKPILQKFDELVVIKNKEVFQIKCDELLDMFEVLKLDKAKKRKEMVEQFAKDYIKILPLISRPRSAYEMEEVRKQREWDKEHHCHSVLAVSLLARNEWEKKKKKERESTAFEKEHRDKIYLNG